jgi:hypothetical protein
VYQRDINSMASRVRIEEASSAYREFCQPTSSTISANSAGEKALSSNSSRPRP